MRDDTITIVIDRPTTPLEDSAAAAQQQPAHSDAADVAGLEACVDAEQAPLFSIIVTTYNRPELLKGALQSLADQTLQDFEVVVVNDGGEPVETILEAFDLDIAYVRRDQNGGPSAARNTALHVCRGRFIGYLDDDDVVLPSHLAMHAQAHAEHPDSVIYTDARYVFSGQDGPPVVSNGPSEEGFSKESLFVRNFIMINNWTHPREMLAEVGEFDETLPALVDWDVLLRLADRFPFVHVRDCTAEVRFHGDNNARLTARRNKDYPNLYRQIYARHGDLDSSAVRQGRIETLAELEAGQVRQLDDYASLLAERTINEETAEFRARVATLAATATASVLILDREGDADAVERTVSSVRGQCLAPAKWVVSGLAGAAALNAAAREAGDGWVLCVTAGDTLDRYALLLLAEKFAGHPQLAYCYVDEDNLASGTPSGPIFKPDFNLDLLRSYPYVGACFAVRGSALAELGGFDERFAALAHVDLLLRCAERFGLQSIGHIAEVLHHAAIPYPQYLASEGVVAESPRVIGTHLQRIGVAHAIEPEAVAGVNRVRYLHARTPAVSIIIPTRDEMPRLNGLIDSLLAKTRYQNHELLIVDNASQDAAACAYLDGIERLNNPQLRVLRWPHPFNYSALNNFAVAEARGEYLILLNNDTAVLHEDWVEAMLNHAQRPEVGVVGAKLHLADGRIQHAGVVLGLHGPAGHPFGGEAANTPGYMQRLQVDQNYSAVSAACLMIRKSVYQEVGGLDEASLANAYNDVDLCLKVRQAGYLVVWTPHARLMHEGGASLVRLDKATLDAKRERIKATQNAMYEKWLPLLARDPAYNGNLGLGGNGFSLDSTHFLGWQPFERPLLPRLFCVAADPYGCGNYRIRQPFLSMQREGMVEGTIATSHLTPVEMERFGPASIVLQRQITEGQIDTMRNYRAFSQAFKVYELDDYMPNLPLKSAHRGDMPKDIMKSLRKALALMDRFVVSTAPLAEQFTGLHGDIRVVLNRLPVDWWGNVAGHRRESDKPRVGWAGGDSHRGDLELIVDVVRELADEVDWVFFGMCPDKLRPYAKELHSGVAISQYPAALAALDLDLALAPLEDNVFNACKSNLRLLEYGACGFPVVCSDIICYRGDLPVTRVRNRFKEWVDAIRMHLADLDATAKMGDALRDTVRRDWMLTGDNLEAWRDAWLPG